MNKPQQAAKHDYGFGNILSEWRKIRKISQLDLAVVTGVSQRHLSFVESGRAQPSRGLILKLANELNLPLRVRNSLLLAAGYAAAFSQRSATEIEMKPVHDAIHRMLRHHEPYPAIVTNAEWDIVMQNSAASRLISACLGRGNVVQAKSREQVNFMRMMFSQDALRPHILNWDQTRTLLFNRLHAEATVNPGCASAILLRELESEASADCSERLCENQDYLVEPVLPLALRVGGVDLRFITMFTSIGASQDIGLRELRIDLSFPADDATREYLQSGISVA